METIKRTLTIRETDVINILMKHFKIQNVIDLELNGGIINPRTYKLTYWEKTKEATK